MSNHDYFFYNDSNPSFTPFSTIYNDVSLISINWNDVLLKPSFSNICFSANYNDLSNTPNLSVYASNIDVSNISNILFINSSNSNINTSNSILNFTSNQIGTIKTSQWISINSNIYYNDGNVGIGTSVFNSDKLIVSGNINSDEYKIKDINISNIFITSNIFENRSNNLFSNLSNQDYISSLTPVVSSQWISDVNSNIYFLDGNVGIGTSSFNSDKLIINGTINTTELKLKGNNISNIFITSNIFENKSNLIINETSNKFLNFTYNQFSTNGNNIFFNLTGNVGIGSSIPKEKLDINGNININGNIIPNTCNTFDLGSSNLKWRDLYLFGNSIHLDNLNINSSNNLLNIKDDNTGLLLGINVNELRLNSNNKIGGIQIDTNGDLKINNKFIVGLDNNYDYSNIIYSNVFSNSSNFLNNSINDKYNSLNTDTIPIGTSNRFITNDIYNRNVNFTGVLTASNIIASNLSIIGDTSIFNTTIYQTEQFQVVNDTTATAMIVKQANSNNNICEFYYNNQLGVVINSNGNIGIGISNPLQKLDVNGTINTTGINIGGVDINTIITSNDTYTSNILITNVSNNNYIISNINFNYSSNSSNSLFINKQDKLTNSSILLGIGSNITNINYNSLSNKPDLSVYTTTTSLNTTSNNIYSNLSNIDYGFSNSNFIYSSNNIYNIIANNYQWTTVGNNIYLNVSGNAGIGSTIPTEKLDINGNMNTNEILIKKANISNIFITSNVFENRSNNSYSNLSNLDFISSNNCIIYTNNKTSGLSVGGGVSSSYWIQTGTSNIYTFSNIGIGTTNPQSKLDVYGDINYTGSLKMNNVVIPFSTTLNTNIIASNASYSNVNNSYGYYMFLTSGTIYFPQATNCDLLLIGAGGNGGLTKGSGGGGAGELIYYPNYPFNVGTSNIQIGYSSFNSNNRITKISSNSVDYIIAKGGGNGGYGYNFTITGTGNSINTAIDDNNYKYAFFNNSGTLILNENIIADILIIGGGGGGGYDAGGGGGGGQVLYYTNNTVSFKSGNAITLNADTYNITIGGGGAFGTSVDINGTNGSSTTISNSIFSITAMGGGGGASRNNLAVSGNIGGGGGGGHAVADKNSFSSSTNYGGRGGKSHPSSYGGGGGGGGANITGTTKDGLDANAIANQYGGNGGSGVNINITGSISGYGGGGGGGSWYGAGGYGTHGGGNGNIINNSTEPTAGTVNTGGGGGSGGNGSYYPQGKNGGSGVVIIRYLNVYSNSSSGGSGGGGFLNTNNQASAGTKWNSTYSFSTTGNNGTTLQGGSGGSVLVSGTYTETITNNNLIIGSGGTGATYSSVPTLKTTYGSGGDGNGGLGTQGLALIKVPLNVQQPIFNGYVYYSNITNKPILNDIILSSNLITSNFNNQLNFPNGNVSWGNEWLLYIGTSPTSVINSFIFQHLTSTINSKWWFNGTTTSTNAEISDERIKKEIQDIPNSLDKLMLLKPKEYYLCDEKDYLKKYGIIAQEVNNNQDLNHLVYNDEDYIANIYIYASFIRENNIYKLITNSSIINKIEVDDELKLLLNNKNNIEIIIEDSPYHNRYKKRYVKVKAIIDETSFEIYEDIELDNNEMYNIFIYGKKVKDFKKLDYSSLYSLNIKATQELYKLIQHQQSIIENLQLRIIELENKI
jgi:hypothetical protein